MICSRPLDASRRMTQRKRCLWMQQPPPGVCNLYGCSVGCSRCAPDAQRCTLSKLHLGPQTSAGQHADHLADSSAAEAPLCCAATMLACLSAHDVASPTGGCAACCDPLPSATVWSPLQGSSRGSRRGGGQWSGCWQHAYVLTASAAGQGCCLRVRCRGTTGELLLQEAALGR